MPEVLEQIGVSEAPQIPRRAQLIITEQDWYDHQDIIQLLLSDAKIMRCEYMFHNRCFEYTLEAWFCPEVERHCLAPTLHLMFETFDDGTVWWELVR